MKEEIWYCRGSRASELARLLRGRYALRAVERKPAARSASPANPSPASDFDGDAAIVWLADLKGGDLPLARKMARGRSGVRIVGVAATAQMNGASRRGLFACLLPRAPRMILEQTIAAAFENIALARRESSAREELARAERETEELNRIGVALSETRDTDVLLDLILRKAREITGADAGSLYLAEERRNEGTDDRPAVPGSVAADRKSPERWLRFKLTQNDTRQFPYAEDIVPIRENSIAGYAAMHGEVISIADAYHMPPGVPYGFNSSYDEQTGYRTKSLLAVPMKNGRGDVLGVLQLINCKRRKDARLTKAEDVPRATHAFPARAIRLALSLASQAAVAYENSCLYRDIETLFEGFVRAAVTAIEQRDPTTSGHSLRVSTMTTGLAEIVDKAAAGPFRQIRFSAEQMKEIRYAALLHDFGKVGVREEVLVKAKKLYPHQVALLQNRFDYVRKDLEAATERNKYQALLESGREAALEQAARHDEELRARMAELDEAFAVIQQANEPSTLPAGQFEKLYEIARRTYRDPRGAEHPLLTSDEVRFLSIRQGSLDPAERLQIESHVVHSFNFLREIPWTKGIREIPHIARSHHEKLNGMGYPYRLKGEDIPIQARMMTICDIFDALSASDRPYKRALPPERALSVLEAAVRDNELDPELFRLFLEGKIFLLSLKTS